MAELSKFQRGFLSARAACVPLVAVATPDQSATVAAATAALDGKADKVPLLQWDISRGVTALNKPGAAAAAKILDGADPSTLTNPGEAFRLAAGLPPNSVLFAMNAGRVVGYDVPNSAAAVQAVANLRDPFRDGRMLVLLGQDASLAPEIAGDVAVLEEELPTDAEVEQIIVGLYKGNTDAAGKPLPVPEGEPLQRAVSAARGLPAFVVEQVTAMATDKATGALSVGEMWDRKRLAIEQTKGLSVYRGTETYADIGGIEQAKRLFERLFAGKNPPEVIVHMDEIEKMLAGSGAGGDSSGVSQDFLGTVLSEMEDQDYYGAVAFGVQGGGKSLVAKATAATFGRMCIRFDSGGMKGRYVGDSEGSIRQAMRVIRAVAGKGGACFVATCNGLWSLPPELLRRFRLGVWFFDVPDEEEKRAIWKVQLARYGLSPKQKRPEDDGWTGADVRTCCDMAWRLDVPLVDAAGYVVPVSKHSPERIKMMRELAHGRFLSASTPGVYEMPGADNADPVPRKMRVGFSAGEEPAPLGGYL